MLGCAHLLHVRSNCLSDHDGLAHSDSLDSVEVGVAATPHILLSLVMTEWPLFDRGGVVHKRVGQHMVLQQVVLLADEVLILLLLPIRRLLLQIRQKMLVLGRVYSLRCASVISLDDGV